MWYVLIVASINLSLGFALALFLDRRLRFAPRLVEQLIQSDARATLAQQMALSKQSQPAESIDIRETSPEDAFSLDQLPAEWLEILKKITEEPRDLIEACAQVLKLEVGEYRRELIDLDSRHRNEPDDLVSAAEIASKAVALTANWRERSIEVDQYLQDHLVDNSENGALVAQLKSAIEEQQASTETIELSEVEKLPENLHALLKSVHKLRDVFHPVVDQIFRGQDRLESLPEQMLYDVETEMYNRSGLEVLLTRWRRCTAGSRLLSMLMIDLDQFNSLNLEIGAAKADRVLSALAHLLNDLRRQQRGFDRPARVSGSQFVIFLGDTGPRNAISASERMRQTIASATFEMTCLNDTTISLEPRVTCGVTEVGTHDTMEDIYERLTGAIQFGKSEGGNCTIIDEGNGPTGVDPPNYPSRGRIVTVD